MRAEMMIKELTVGVHMCLPYELVPHRDSLGQSGSSTMSPLVDDQPMVSAEIPFCYESSKEIIDMISKINSA